MTDDGRCVVQSFVSGFHTAPVAGWTGSRRPALSCFQMTASSLPVFARAPGRLIFKVTCGYGSLAPTCPAAPAHDDGQVVLGLGAAYDQLAVDATVVAKPGDRDTEAALAGGDELLRQGRQAGAEAVAAGSWEGEQSGQGNTHVCLQAVTPVRTCRTCRTACCGLHRAQTELQVRYTLKLPLPLPCTTPVPVPAVQSVPPRAARKAALRRKGSPEQRHAGASPGAAVLPGQVHTAALLHLGGAGAAGRAPGGRSTITYHQPNIFDIVVVWLTTPHCCTLAGRGPPGAHLQGGSRHATQQRAT